MSRVPQLTSIPFEPLPFRFPVPCLVSSTPAYRQVVRGGEPGRDWSLGTSRPGLEYPTKSDSDHYRYLRSNQANVQVLSCLFLHPTGNQARAGLPGRSLDLLLSHGYVFFKFNIIFDTAPAHVFFSRTTNVIPHVSQL